MPVLPVTVLCGFAGTGKTTLRQYLEAHTRHQRVAVIDDVDALGSIAELAAQASADAVIVELPSTADPMVFAESFVENDWGDAVQAEPVIDAVVTVVDASRFLLDLGSTDSLADRDLVAEEDDDRTVGERVIDQVEFCDVLVVNHADRVSDADLSLLRHILVKINPRAHQIVAKHGEVAPESLIGTQLFDFEAAASAPGWLTALEHDARALLRDDAVGAGIFVYRARRPFHPTRFFTLLHEEWKGVLRSKGYFWIASRNDMAGTLSQTGSTCRPGAAGYWWIAQPTDEWPDDEAFKAELAHDWFTSPDAQGQETVGDRRQELVMIGLHLDRDAWQRKLDACLLDDGEQSDGPTVWRLYDDPFPQWDEDHDHDHDHEHHSDHGHDHDHH